MATPSARVAGSGGEVALSPAQRSAMIYALDDDDREEIIDRSLEAVRELEGVDLTMWMDGEEAVIRGHRGELRFAPGDGVQDARGQRLGVSTARCPCCVPRSRTVACSAPSIPTR